MKSKYLYYILYLAIFVLTTSFHPQSKPSNLDKVYSYSSELKDVVAKIEAMPEAAALISEVQKDGPVKVQFESMQSFNFEALWNATTRTITVNKDLNKTTGGLITSILFELHNAKSSKTLVSLFDLAQSGRIDKESYVSKVEKMEHSNALNTAQLIEKGISKGIFPQDSKWKIYTNFDDHYKLQQIYGHSQWIANKYDAISPLPKKPYYGTIKNLNYLSKADKNDLASYLSIKNKISSPNPEEKNLAIEQKKIIINNFNFCKENPFSAYCKRYNKQRELFNIVFNS